MTNPLTVIKEHLSKLTNAQRIIADYILKNSSEVAFLTIHDLAQRVNTSSTTIMRLMSNLGYSGYSEFQKGLQKLIRDQTAPQTRLEINLENVNKDDLWGNTINHHLYQIQKVMEQMPKSQLDEVVKKITSSRQVICTSVRSGLPIGQYLTHGLNRTLGNCRLVIADTSDWVDEIITMKSEDLIIATSFPRYAKRIIDFVKAAKCHGVQIVAITDSYSSPIVEYADIVLPCDSDSLAFHNSPIVAMIVADYLINATAIGQSEETRKRLDKINEMLKDMNYHY
ncbi:transcriptional regulator RpiR family SIS domain protein [Alkalihalophilus pseudofirmus OF4]|uniref:Transcriptional regulator RpiR family SIS domain protein n=1 Tax=Alkalihalophilus pseudofirmus (strain ATCC BAA-2126 / JCM 17055 / OF4) TaxID=398511 RepID=D3FQD9_ALKPO|nr:MurR/RpiR family transcriptional regulator [Alkalihalophilus pseudofirmus]ADC49611.1 transcriptional regulator RpiR family SIS domain protein [Alkalihalophilus pseudofirmus OF4]